MPLKANLKKKTEQEKEQSYTKPKNNVSLPKKTVTTAKQSAQAIKSSVGGKKTTYKPSAKKEQEVKNRIATQKNYGSEKSDASYRNTRLGKTSSYTAQASYKKGREAITQKAEDTGLYVNKVNTTTPRKKRDNTNPTRGNGRDTSQKKTNRNNYNKHRLDEGAKDIQNRALSGQLNADEPTRYITDVHGRTAVDDRVRVNNLDDWFNVGGKFLSNAMDSTIDYSPVTIPYTLATGETLTNGAYYDNPYEEQRQQGLSAGAGRMAGMALNYGIARSAANPLLEQAANAVMNGTKVGALISNSATLGKIGQAVGTNTAKDIATGLVKETISDATLGAGQNALINYAEGLRGEDFWRQMAKDEALDFAIGGIMEGAGIGKQIGRAGREAADISEENVKDLLANTASRGEYADALKARGLELKEKSLDTANAGKNLREASAKKGTEYTDEYRKTLNMTDKQFNRYQKGRDINTKYYDPVNRKGVTSAKAKTSVFNLTDSDIKEWSNTGKKRQIKVKNKNLESGAVKPIRNEEEAREFINKSIDNKGNSVIAPYGRANSKLVEDIRAYTKGDIDLEGKFMELQGDDVWHAFDNHIEPKQEGNIPLSREDFLNIPEYVSDYDKLVEVVSTSDGARIKLAKQINGYSIITELYYESSSSLRFKNMWGIKTEDLDEVIEKALPYRPTSKEEMAKTFSENLPENSLPQQSKEVKGNSNGKQRTPSDRVDSPDSTAYNNVKGEETNGRKDTQPVQEGNLQQGTATGNSGSKSVLPEERPRNAGDIRVETEGRSRTSGDVQVSKSNLVSDDVDKVLRTDKRITERTAKSADNIEEFSKRLDENRKNNEYGYCVSPVDPKIDDGSTRYYTTHNGQVTAGVAKDGNIVALSKSSNATEGANSHEALMTAFGMGGNRADAYGIGLATHYQRYGLVPVARVPFDENVVREYFRPEDVDDALAMFRKMKDVGNEPDVYFFAKFDDLKNTIKTRDNGGYKILSDDELRKLPEMDYDSAEKYRNQLLDNSAKRNAYMKEHGINGTFTEAKATTVEGAKRPTKRLGKKAETVKPQETTKTSNGGGDLPKGGKIEKVGEFEVVGGGKGVETTTPAETKLSAIEQLKKTLRNARRDLINSEAGLERMDKVAKQTKIQEKSYMTRNAKGQAGYILNKKLVNLKGEEIGKSLSDVLGGKIEYKGKTYDSPFKDKATAKLFDEYAMELHNTYRAIQGKNIYGGRDYVEEVDQIVKNYPALAGEKDRLLKWLNDTDGTTSKEQRKALEERLRNKYENFDDVIKDLNKYRAAKSQANVDRILKEHPEFAKVTEEMDKWWGSFTDEYLVKSGIISAKDVKKFKEIYPHYVPTFRDMGEAAGKESKNAATLIKKATGSGKRQLLTVPEQYAHQIDRIVTAARRNELNQEIINTISRDPAGMKAFGAIQDGKGKLTYDFSEGDLDDFIATLDDISLNQIKSGKNTITAVFNGEKVTANISDEVAKSLEAMSNIQDTNLLVKVGKTITNPMKFTITGGNPVFFISNMMRDLPTLYIQSNHGFVKTTTGLFKATKEVFTNGEKYKMYKALGGAEAGYYMRGKGFETSASTRGVIKRVQEVMSFLGEKGEAIPRLAEFINTLEKTGDAYKALRDAAESTVDFSRRGSSDVAKALDAWTLYLNAGLQGLDKFARTVAAHPVRTLGRSATMLGIPYMALTALNQDNPYYQELTERVKQNNFLIPNLAGEKDEDGNCKTFVKVPLNREYGTVFATSLYCALKAARGEDDSWEGFRETFEENFLPNNPFTDNILAPLLINIPQNKDFAGRSIIPSSLKDASPENQYDYDTSEFAKLISKGMNRIPVKDVPIVKYLQSPKLVDYILDSYTGYYGQVLQSATTTGGTSKDNYVKDVLVKQTAEQPFLNKFVADSRYSSKPVEDFYNMKDEYTQLKTDAEIEGKTWSEAHAAEHALSKISKGLYESTQAEKAILADKSLTKAEKDKMIGELRTARNELAKEAKQEVTNAVAEYRQAPTFSELSDTTKEKWSASLGIKKEQWATAYKKMTDEYDSRKEENEDAKMTADEKRLYLIENGITTYKQAQSILGENTSKNKWDEALAMHKKGETYDSLTTATLEKVERQKDMTETEIKFDNNFRTRSDSRYDGKTVSKKMYDNFLYEVQYVDKHTDNNGSIKQSEAQNAIENLDQMYGLTQEQKAYLWYLAENVNSKGEGWKKQPYGKWNG